MEKSNLIGEILAKRAKEKNISNVYFDKEQINIMGESNNLLKRLEKMD